MWLLGEDSTGPRLGASPVGIVLLGFSRFHHGEVALQEMGRGSSGFKTFLLPTIASSKLSHGGFPGNNIDFSGC